MSPIITSFWAKPVPSNKYDWEAYRDPGCRTCGYGSTEQEAINDLVQQEEEAR